jgi:hydroxypyruvate isomerase
MSTQKNNNLSRRTFVRNASLTAVGAAAGSLAHTAVAGASEGVERIVKNGRINQSVCKWCYREQSLEELCAIGKKMGLKAIDLIGPQDFATLKKYGLESSMVGSHSLTKGMNSKDYHADCIGKMRDAIDAAADSGFRNVISFSGNREGIPDDVGVENAVEGYKKIVGQAEKKKVYICIEYLNSKVNHKGYMFDNMAWGVEVCKRVGSDRLKILYDIYHAQIMEGDIIRTIRDYHQYIGHYHTGGNPGRNEIDHTQELYYPAIMKAIAETGYDGYVAHEFVPKNDPIESLAYAVRICDV